MSYRFRVAQLAGGLLLFTAQAATQTETPIQYGNTLMGSVEQCGGGVAYGLYVLTASKGDKVIVHATETNDYGGICWGVGTCAFDQCVELRDDQNAVIGTACTPLKNNACLLRRRTQLGPLIIPHDGKYMITVRDANSFGRGTFAITVQKTNVPAQASGLLPSDVRLISFQMPGEVRAFTINALQNSFLKAEMKSQVGAVLPRLALYGPDGEPIALPEGGEIQQALRQGGQHTLLAFSSANETGTAELTVMLSTTPPPSSSQVLSQIADGNGWQTALTLMNTASEPGTYSLRFWTGSGTPWAVSFDASIEGSIPAGGSRTITTLNQSSTIQQGWAELISSKAVRLFGTFRSPAGQEAIVLGTTREGRFLLPFDNTQNLVTALALVNTNDSQPANVRIVFRDEMGIQLGASVMVLAPRGHDAFALADRFPVSSARRGVAEFTMDTPDLTGLGLRFLRNGAFTSIPVQPIQ